MKKTRLQIYLDAGALALNTLDAPEGEQIDSALLQEAGAKGHTGPDYSTFKQFFTQLRSQYLGMRNQAAPSEAAQRKAPAATPATP